MKTLPMKKLFGALVVAGAAAQAQAITITQEQDFGSLVDPKAFASFTEILTFNMFDSNLGTLDSVRVEMDLDIAGGVLAADNDGANPATINGELGATGELTSSDVALIRGDFQNVLGPDGLKHTTVGQFNLGADDGDAEVGGSANFSSQGLDYGFFNGQAGSDTGGDFINSVVFNQYQAAGGGTFDIEAMINGINNVGGSAVQGQFDPVAGAGKVRVIYEYTAVDAPIGLPLMGLMMLGLTLNRRKQATQA